MTPAPKLVPGGAVTRRRLLRRGIELALVGIGGGLLAACSPGAPTAVPAGNAAPGAAPAGQPKRGGTLIYAQTGDPASFDTVRATGSPAAFAANQVYDHLIAIGPDGTYVPSLATSWDIAADLRTYTFKLRQGVKFHDGSDFNAAAVKFNYQRFQDKDQSAMVADYAVIEKIETPDPNTVVFQLKQPRVAFLEENVGEWRATIASPAAIQKGAREYGTHPVGTGPWKFVDWTPDDRYTLERNPDYWGGAPLLDKLVVRSIPDTQTRALELQRGGVHISVRFTPEQITQFRSDQNVGLQEATSLTVRGWSLNVRKPLLQDARVRRALYHAVDLDTFVKAQLGNTAVRSRGPVYVKSIALDPSVQEPSYDPEQAKALLTEAGWATGSDGVMTRDGQRLELVLFFGTGHLPKGKEMAEGVQQYFARVGVALKLEEREYVAHLKAVSEMKHDLATLAIGPRSPDPVLTALDVGFRSDGRLNYSGYANQEFDQLVTQGASVADMEQRKKSYFAAQQVIMRDLPAIFAYNDVEIAAVRTNVQGYAHSALQDRNLFDKVWLA